ncbi:kinase-like protein [Ganoderma leucocontextum]|nr:kinase-like protein [Ganoderma leucocontextum]
MLQEEKIRRGLLVEMRAYGMIAAAAPRERAYLMELFGVLQDEERVVYLMPLMEGDLIDVSKAVASYGGLDRSLVRRWVAQLALGIDALHRMGIIHRDLKPENILVNASNPGQDPDVRIADFNTAFIAHSPLEDGTSCTNGRIGSAPYMAWEVDQGWWYGKMVDWWALGCIIFDMLTNTVLFEGHDDRQEYVWWDHKMDGMSYAAYHGKGKISDTEVELIDGLVDLHPSSRFQLRHLRHHEFFLDEKKHVNIFNVLLREPAADLLTDASPSSSVKVDGSLRNEPPVHLFFQGDRLPLVAPGSETKSRRYRRDDAVSVEYAHVPELDDPFASLDWLNPRGPWRV